MSDGLKPFGKGKGCEASAIIEGVESDFLNGARKGHGCELVAVLKCKLVDARNAVAFCCVGNGHCAAVGFVLAVPDDCQRLGFFVLHLAFYFFAFRRGEREVCVFCL